MRPRVFPAEDAGAAIMTAASAASFNEAAGIPRGRLVRIVDCKTGRVKLQ